MSKKLAAVALSFGLLMAACAPATQVQTTTGSVYVHVLGSAAYLVAEKVPFEQLNDQTDNNAAILFPECGNYAVRAADVRRYGPTIASYACKLQVERERNAFKFSPYSLVLVPIALGVFYFISQKFVCPALPVCN